MTFGGLPTRWEPPGESRGVALVAPGRAYSPAAPLLEFARRAQLRHGFTVQQLWWDSTARSDDDHPEQWVRRHVEAAERGLDAIWFTPVLTEAPVAEAIAANAGRQLLVLDHATDRVARGTVKAVR